MARAGTQRWRNPAPEGDDVQRSIELLDKVLSEYDEHEAEGEGEGGGGGGRDGDGDGDGGAGDGNGADGELGDCGSSTEPSIGLTPDDESPSLGHQSEDDGYMSMNGRKAKMALVALRPVPDCPETQDPAGVSTQEFPPPPEEAERIISTLLPIVSPGNSSKRSTRSSDRRNGRQQWIAAMGNGSHHGNAVTTQTTLPKTRHQRPYGWENGDTVPVRPLKSTSPPSKFGSLPCDGKLSFNWIPPRTNPTAMERHREVRRRSSAEDLDKGPTSHRPRSRQNSKDKERTSDLRKPQRQQQHHHFHHHHHRHQKQLNEMTKSSSVEDGLLMDRCGQGDNATDGTEERDVGSNEESRRRGNESDSSESRFSRYSESGRSSIPRSSSVSVERFSMRANCDSSDFSRANSTSNERFHSDFSIAVASASSNDRVSAPTSEPYSLRNLDFAFFTLPRSDSADVAERFSTRTSDRCSEERYSDVFSTRNSDFSTRNSTDFRTQSEEEERFSDDSLEELLPPVAPSIGKRHSIAWEVSLEDDPLYAPGSTKVVGRRRRKSSDVSSVGSASKLRDFDDWQDPRLSTTDDDLISPYSDSSTNELDQVRPQDLTKNGTYVIRRGRKKERKVLPKTPTKTKSLSMENGEEGGGFVEPKRYSSTFDDIQSLLKESKLEGLDEPPAEFVAPTSAELMRVTSLPAIDGEVDDRNRLEITVEEEEVSSDASDEDDQQPATCEVAALVNIPGRRAKRCSRASSLPEQKAQAEDSVDYATRNCNGVGLPTSALSFAVGEDVSVALDSVRGDEDVKKAATMGSGRDRRSIAGSSTNSAAAKIPVNLLIEDQIVKKALNENRRQLEKVSDAIKEIESVKNSESYSTESRARWRNGDVKTSAKKNGYENERDVADRRSNVDGSFEIHCKHPASESDASKSPAEGTPGDQDARKINGTDIYASGRRMRQNGIENHKNDQRQIENVIDAILEDSKNPDFQVSVLEFPPLPPSPVEEADEEGSDVGQSSVVGGVKSKSRANRTMEYRPRVPPHRAPIGSSDSKETRDSSLNTRSMDAGFARGWRTPAAGNSRREVPVERRTLPTDLPGPSRRRPFTKRHSPSAEPCTSSNASGNGGQNTSGNIVSSSGGGMQTSCSLPETPVFARGSDIPRTPQHANNPTTTQTRRPPGWYAPATATTGGYRRNNPGLEQAIIGTELLRLAGGPNRGWYPTRKGNQQQQQPRPASIEHLERLNSAYEARLPGPGDQRKPLTLPTNITPNKYFGQSKHSSASSTREALRRVTSLLIKKGSGSKEGKGKDNTSPSGPYAAAECTEAPKKKGFFKGFWKRSRHYSLENQ